MDKAKRARKAETPKQPSLCLRLCAPYLYPDPTATLAPSARPTPARGLDGGNQRLGGLFDFVAHDYALNCRGARALILSRGGRPAPPDERPTARAQSISEQMRRRRVRLDGGLLGPGNLIWAT